MAYVKYDIVLILLVFASTVHGRPGQLNEEVYEFPNFQNNWLVESVGHVEIRPVVESLHEDTVQHEVTPWSQLHQDEVFVFAEICRQHYNRIIEAHNGVHEFHLLGPLIRPLYELPDGYSWHNLFGDQLQHVNDLAEQVTQQVIGELLQDRRAQNEFMIENILVNRAAMEIDEAHASKQKAEFQQHEFSASGVNQFEEDIQQSFQPIYATDDSQLTNLPSEQEYVSNDARNHIRFLPTDETDSFHYAKDFAAQDSIENVFEQQHVYDQRGLPDGKIPSEVFDASMKQNNRDVETDSTEILEGSHHEQVEVWEPMLSTTPRINYTTSKPTLKVNNVMSLVRPRTVKKQEEAIILPTESTSIKPTTESNVMSMLPNKRPSIDHTEIQEKIRQTLDEHIRKHGDDGTEETHFMGITSNREHSKLSYDTVGNDPSEAIDSSNDIVQNHVTGNQVTTDTFTTSTTSKSNVFYSAPLAPFPATTQEKFDEFQVPQYATFPVMTSTQQGRDEFSKPDVAQEEFNTQQVADVEQWFDDTHDSDPQNVDWNEQISLSEQSSRGLNSSPSPAGPNFDDEYYRELATATVVPLTIEKNWFQRQWGKFKNIF